MDETFIKVAGESTHLCRAVDWNGILLFVRSFFAEMEARFVCAFRLWWAGHAGQCKASAGTPLRQRIGVNVLERNIAFADGAAGAVKEASPQYPCAS
jgi:hypothetical protein